MTFQLPASNIQFLLLALLSAALLVLSFPNFNQPWCAWVALVPWLWLLRRVTARRAFWWSWLIGFLFFLGSIWWLVHVTVFGWIVLCAYLALYFGLFGLVVLQCFGLQLTAYSLPLVIPATWVALEFARNHLLSGFGWNLLAYSQTPWLPVIQVADLTGVWGVSFLIVMANVGFAQAIHRWTQDSRPKTQVRTPKDQFGSWVLDPRSPMVAPAIIIALVFAYGRWRLQRPHSALAPAHVAVAQGNVPQEQKWDEAYAGEILRRYERLTRVAAAAQPDLIVWPETSVPGYLGVEEELTQRLIKLATDVKRPLLVGSPIARLTPRGLTFLNRATLITADGEMTKTYDKVHLVPFGEFVPGEEWFPWLRSALPPIGDFVPGEEYTVFSVARQLDSSSAVGPTSRRADELKFSVLICFEDVFPELARQFVRRGARMLVVITNDAWFGPTAAAYQHAQASAFRAVELGVPVVRAANTGWSGCIDAQGAWREAVKDAEGRELWVEGTATCDVRPGSSATPYLRWGDWFAWGCVLTALGWIVRKFGG